jgi:hypothetical protein
MEESCREKYYYTLFGKGNKAFQRMMKMDIPTERAKQINVNKTSVGEIDLDIVLVLLVTNRFYRVAGNKKN